MPAAIGRATNALIGAAPIGSQPLGDPVVQAPGASPFTYTNNSAHVQQVYVKAAAGATTTVAKRGRTLLNFVTAAATNASGHVTLGPGESCVVTYTVAPTMEIDTP